MKERLNVGIIGTGLVGSDLLTKVQRSPHLECGIFAGRREGSPGIARAKEMGIATSIKSIEAINGNCDIVFDATSAQAHFHHAEVLRQMGVFAIDLTPSRVGRLCVPLINLEDCLKEPNVNLSTCGGQAIAPIARAIMQVHPETEYMEVVSTIASKSAGMGTRENIDEFTQATADVLRVLAGVPEAKAIIILNPAEPPIQMRNTLYAQIKHPDIGRIRRQVAETIKGLKEYIPGYKLIVEPTHEKEEGRVTTAITVVGSGDYLPIFAGNLDIINCAAICLGEAYAKRN